MVVGDVPNYMQIIIQLLIENAVGKQPEGENEKLKEVLKMINGIGNRDLGQIFSGLSELKSEFGLESDEQFKWIQSITFLMNKLKINNEDSKTELIDIAIPTLSNWIMSLLQFSDEKTKATIYIAVKSYIAILLGAKYLNKKVLKQGLDRFVPLYSAISKMLNCIRTMKNYLFENGLSIKDLNSQAIQQLIASFMGLIKLCNGINQLATDLQKDINKRAVDLRAISLPVHIY